MPKLSPREPALRLQRPAPRARGRRLGWLRNHRVLAVIAAAVLFALAAPQLWSQTWSPFQIGDAGAADLSLEPMPFEQAGQSFPGSAFYYLAPETETGADATAKPLDPGAHWDGESMAGPVARSLRAQGSAIDRTRALTCLTQAIYYEAASEPDAGQRAVAQVVLNRVAHPAYPSTVCGVVYQGSEKTTGCQFTFTCDGALARAPSRLFWLRAESVARRALAGEVYAPVGLATHYHTIAVHPYWADSLGFLGTIGAHRFYRLGGRAGAPALFNPAVYRGGEPLAAPHPRAAGATTPDSALDPLAIERAYAKGFAAAQAGTAAWNNGPAAATAGPVSHATPAYAPALQARGGDALYTAQTLPGSTAVRPEYAASGQWIARPGT